MYNFIKPKYYGIEFTAMIPFDLSSTPIKFFKKVSTIQHICVKIFTHKNSLGYF